MRVVCFLPIHSYSLSIIISKMTKKKLRIIYHMDKCIGNGSCAAIAPDYFELQNSKATLLRSKQKNNIFSIEKDLNEDGAKAVIEAAIACPVNAIRIIDLAKKKDVVSFELNEKNAKKVMAKFDDAKEFALDGDKYFLIRINRRSNNIEVGFCRGKNNLILKVVGKKPLEIYQTILNKWRVDISKDHAAYLGKELEKSYIALTHNLEYIQDEELDFKKKHNNQFSSIKKPVPYKIK